MKLSYDPETDSLYIDLMEKEAADSREVSPGVVLDFGDDGTLVGIDIDRASTRIKMDSLQTAGLPEEMLRHSA